MKKINENTKVTLTFGQLKRLVKESFDDLPEDDDLAQAMADLKRARKEYKAKQGRGLTGVMLKRAEDKVKELKKARKESIKGESREPFGDFDYPEWMDDVEYHKGEKPDIAKVLRDLGWSVAVDDEKLKATTPDWRMDITFHEGDKIMQRIGDLFTFANRRDIQANTFYVEQAFEEIKSAVEMTMTSPLDESEDGIDFKFINSTLDQIVKTVSDCKMTLQDLYRDARYGKAPATMERRQKVMQAMSDIRNFAHDISQEVK